MTVEVKPLAEVTQRAIRVLVQQIGPADTARFVTQFTVGYGNYTEERQALFASMTLDDIVAEIKRAKEHIEPRS
jgi:hypothetical protein